MNRSMWKQVAATVLGLVLLTPTAWAAKTTVATTDGNWSDAIWNNGAPEAGDTAIINSGVSVTLTNTTPALGVFTNNGTLTFNNWDTALTAVDVVVNGTVTHPAQSATAAPWVPDHRVWIVCSNLTVLADAMIDANGKGYFPSGPGNSGGSRGRDGAGHGGAGGIGLIVGGPIYGITNAPVDPGSSGGAQSAPTGGSPGGGVVRIQAEGAVTVHGTIQADGLAYGGDKGGGSGGSIYIDCLGILGTGVIRVRGGNAGSSSNSGGGGGGRIALYYDAFDTFFGDRIITGGYQSVLQTDTAASGKPGTLVWDYAGSDPRLTVEGVPQRIGAPTPYVYGSISVAADTAVTGTVVSPAGEAAGQRFVLLGWNAATNGVIVASDTTTEAAFAMPATHTTLQYVWTNQYTLTVDATGGGSVSGESAGWYTNGTTATITQSAFEGYSFVQWIGDVPDGAHRDAALTVVMNRPRAVTAVFTSNTPTTKTWTGTGNWTNAAHWSPVGMPGTQDSVIIGSGSMTLAQPVWIADLVVSNGATVAFTAWPTVLNAANVALHGTLTHAPCVASLAVPEISNRVALACQTLWISSGGVINANGKGYAPGGPGTAMTSARHGGSYGGVGGSGYGGVAAAYGTVAVPTDPGSSGGAQSTATGGGKGGGAVWLDISGRLTVDGTIMANGMIGGGDAGGGSGGGIHITAQTFAGTGMIQADGGPAAATINAGGGGGGRIALHYNPALQVAVEPKPALLLSSAPGSVTLARHGTLGTLYLTDAQLLPEHMTAEFNGVIWNVAEWSPTSLVCSGLVQFADTTMSLISSGDMLIDLPAGTVYQPALNIGRIACDGHLTVAQRALTLSDEHALLLANDLTLADAASLTVASGLTNGVAPGYGALVDVYGKATIGNGCWIYPVSHPSNGGSVFFRFGNLVIAPNAGFNASERGFASRYNNTGYGPGAGWQDGTGGGYGGLGGRTSPTRGGLTNGIAEAPGHPGSAGFGQNNSVGGHGGGYVRIDVARALQISGSIIANGGNAPAYAGAGAGGGIYLTCGTFVGTPTAALRANGGTVNTPQYWTCGGGGGRIAVWRVSEVNGEGIMTAEALGGIGSLGDSVPGYSGTDGTVFWGWSPARGTLILLR